MNFSGELTDEHKQEMMKHANFKQENIVDHYNETCDNYEQIYLRAGWNDPLKCAELANDVLVENREEANIMDMGCGTGLVGKYLSDFGFKHITGIDASAGMLEKARSKNVYDNLDELFLGMPDTFPNKYHSRFDAITASGILAEGHLGNAVFDEMLIALKVGGFACFSTRTMYLTQYNYIEKMTALTEAGKWELVKEITFDRYDQLEEAIGRFTKVEVKGFAYKKL